MQVEIIAPYGFCAGVKRAISILEKTRQDNPNEKIYCIGNLVHNQEVNDELAKKGIIFLSGDKEKIIDSLNDGIIVFSAHGTSPRIISKAKEKGLRFIDAACLFVVKELDIIKEKIDQGYDVIYIGTKNHEEASAALSISDKIHFVSQRSDVDNLKIDNAKIAVINQTTLSITSIVGFYEAIKEKYDYVEIVDEICNSTRVRQEKLINHEIDADGIIIVGDKTSNNSVSLYTISKERGYDTILVSKYDDIDHNWFKGKSKIAILSGTSTPNKTVEDTYNNIIKL